MQCPERERINVDEMSKTVNNLKAIGNGLTVFSIANLDIIGASANELSSKT